MPKKSQEVLRFCHTVVSQPLSLFPASGVLFLSFILSAGAKFRLLRFIHITKPLTWLSATQGHVSKGERLTQHGRLIWRKTRKPNRWGGARNDRGGKIHNHLNCLFWLWQTHGVIFLSPIMKNCDELEVEPPIYKPLQWLCSYSQKYELRDIKIAYRLS